MGMQDKTRGVCWVTAGMEVVVCRYAGQSQGWLGDGRDGGGCR